MASHTLFHTLALLFLCRISGRFLRGAILVASRTLFHANALLLVFFGGVSHAIARICSTFGPPARPPEGHLAACSLRKVDLSHASHTLLHPFAPLLALPGALPKAIWLHVLFRKLISQSLPHAITRICSTFLTTAPVKTRPQQDLDRHPSYGPQGSFLGLLPRDPGFLRFAEGL